MFCSFLKLATCYTYVCCFPVLFYISKNLAQVYHGAGCVCSNIYTWHLSSLQNDLCGHACSVDFSNLRLYGAHKVRFDNAMLSSLLKFAVLIWSSKIASNAVHVPLFAQIYDNFWFSKSKSIPGHVLSSAQICDIYPILKRPHLRLHVLSSAQIRSTYLALSKDTMSSSMFCLSFP